MPKQKKLILIPLVFILVLLVYCWTVILTTNIHATWRHYIGLIFFVGLVFLFLKNTSKAVIATGVYLLLATFNLLAMAAEITTGWFRIGSIYSPQFQLLSSGLFLLYFILNLNTLIDLYLYKKEVKHSKTQDNSSAEQ